ncbi:MAG: GNAT family N-acetyltransferase [Clostridium sp.]|uniref:GNAT family N-acetyltransferase n=1 Tax=Clostridium sp. TaxID=1506 RepID=UPI003F2D2207
MIYEELNIGQAEKICDIDGECYIHNAWREVNGVRTLIEINWTDYELPNGLSWHIEHFKASLSMGGKAIGCFDNGRLVGYIVLNSDIFGDSSKYILLDQFFISKNYRNKGIGKRLFNICCELAREFRAEKIYICAGSSEDTIAFYFKLGCVEATEINEELYEMDRNDYQLEYTL